MDQFQWISSHGKVASKDNQKSVHKEQRKDKTLWLDIVIA